MSNEIALRETPDIAKIDSLPAEEKQRVLTIKQGISYTDSQAVVQYGVGAQGRIADFADSILSEIRNKDAGTAGNSLSDLLVTIKHINVDGLGARNPLASIPIIGGLVDAARRFVQRYEKLSVQIERITNDLDRARVQMLKDIAMLDKLFEKNWVYLHDLDLFILAGKMALEEVQKSVIPALQEKAKSTGDPQDAQKLQDALQFADRFDKKIHDLILSRMVSIQTAPQIRLIQNNDQLLVEKIQTSILNTIPLWKNQIVIAISLFRQKKALMLQKEVTDSTNELLAKNSEMLKESSLEVARQSERGIVDLETLQKVNADLIATLEETIHIQDEGRTKRRAAEEELKKMEDDLKQKLVAVRN
ncbi:MAG TPA: toxic anion resistance protein [Bacteroidota bacterium]|nr:toxic anion resistance protein [Bacteroidota bacterium]